MNISEKDNSARLQSHYKHSRGTHLLSLSTAIELLQIETLITNTTTAAITRHSKLQTKQTHLRIFPSKHFEGEEKEISILLLKKLQHIFVNTFNVNLPARTSYLNKKKYSNRSILSHLKSFVDYQDWY